MVLTVDSIKSHNLILLECISGSKAYGLDTSKSDTDKRGVFYLSRKSFYGLHSIDQISNETNDESYSELGRFFELLIKSNPTMIELLNTPEEHVMHQHPFFKHIKAEFYLSKQCKDTFAGYAITQVKKARGLNKKILNPIEKQRKSILDFCYVPYDQGAIPLQKFLEDKGLKQEDCGLTKIPHMHEVYGLYHDESGHYKGVMRKEEANDVALSSISKGEEPLTIMSFNKSGYSAYCREYKEYWEWVEKRNDARYDNTMAHGKRYDAKNMMHTFRLLNMAHEIAIDGKVNVRRPDRDFLLRIRAGDFEYEYLLEQAEDKISAMQEAYQSCDLPDSPDVEKLNELLVGFREEIYIK
ncbi:MAG: nucleotidyltransferase domain-containing protein [Bacteroidota bacterium]